MCIHTYLHTYLLLTWAALVGVRVRAAVVAVFYAVRIRCSAHTYRVSCCSSAVVRRCWLWANGRSCCIVTSLTVYYTHAYYARDREAR